MAQETTLQPNAKQVLEKLVHLQRQFQLFLSEENLGIARAVIEESDAVMFPLSKMEVKEIATLSALIGRSVLDAEYELLGQIVRAVYVVGFSRGKKGFDG